MIIDIFITIWNAIYSIIAFTLSLPKRIYQLIKKLICPTKRIKR